MHETVALQKLMATSIKLTKYVHVASMHQSYVLILNVFFVLIALQKNCVSHDYHQYPDIISHEVLLIQCCIAIYV